jgi:hypothetical protein
LPVFAARPLNESTTFDLSSLVEYEGKEISEIQFHGLIWTQENAIRWLLGGEKGEKFNIEKWKIGLHKIYNTGVLYDLKTEVTFKEDGTLKIDFSAIDKWPILPYVNFQGGGGAANLGLGILHTNLFGYFTNGTFNFSSFNGFFAYDVNLSQEWIGKTDYVALVDISRTGYPISVLNPTGQIVENFSWYRNQQQIMAGKRIGDSIRFYNYLEFYQDTLTQDSDAMVASVNSQFQFRYRPTIIFGRSNWTNFLEQGYELNFSPWVANFWSKDIYAGFSASLKQVFIISKNDNLAYIVNIAATTSRNLPYQYHLGGYDTARGFNSYRFLGSYLFNSTVEYRPYLWSDRFSFLGVDQIALQGCLFIDMGVLVNDSAAVHSELKNRSLGLLSAGLGLRLNFVRFAGAILRFDFARTISPDEGFGFSFGIGQFF